MFAKIAAFFRSFFTNAAADPVSTGKGLVQLATAGGVAYSLATGKLAPDATNVGFVTAATASGLHAIGSNTAAVKVEQTGQEISATIQTVESQAAQISNLYQTLHQEVTNAQEAIAAAQTGAANLAAIVPSVAPEVASK